MTCRHHWRLGPPSADGSTTGQCAHCGAERTFSGGIAEGRDALRVRRGAPLGSSPTERQMSSEERAAATVAAARRAAGRKD